MVNHCEYEHTRVEPGNDVIVTNEDKMSADSGVLAATTTPEKTVCPYAHVGKSKYKIVCLGKNDKKDCIKSPDRKICFSLKTCTHWKILDYNQNIKYYEMYT